MSDDYFDMDDEIVAGVVALAAIGATLIVAAVAGIWLSLWAINKPAHPSACDHHRSECAAAVEGMR